MGRFEKQKPFIVALDFDGTLKRDSYYNHRWEEWELSPGFKELYDKVLSWETPVVFALWTCRNLQVPEEREPVENFLKKFGIEQICLDFTPTGKWKCQGREGSFWSTGSQKMYADIYVDDLGFVCPVTEEGDVRWPLLEQALRQLAASVN